jgi:NAD(P)-dependent dehydrogenase (short-subunit alcohol dehydrogenase family)
MEDAMAAQDDLRDRVALVTGATRNIGLAIAARFARAGADLVITGRNPDRLGRVVEELRDIGRGRVLGVAADITDTAAVTRLADAALGTFERVDIVVNNALVVAKEAAQSTPAGRTVLTAPQQMWDDGLAGYLHGPLTLLRHLVPPMTAHGAGSVINLVSTANFRIVEGFGVYGVLKATLWALTRYLAAELAPEVRVNALCPGTVSPSGTLDEAAQMGRADEVAAAALVLASDASSYTTGQVIMVDGGRVSLS